MGALVRDLILLPSAFWGKAGENSLAPLALGASASRKKGCTRAQPFGVEGAFGAFVWLLHRIRFLPGLPVRPNLGAPPEKTLLRGVNVYKWPIFLFKYPLFFTWTFINNCVVENSIIVKW